MILKQRAIKKKCAISGMVVYLANTPLMQVIMAQRQYWYFGKKVKDAVPKLNVLQINLHPARVDYVPSDHDGTVNRNSDISFGDRSKNDETVLLSFRCIMELIKELIKLAKDNGATQKMIDDLLDRPIPHQERLEGARGTTYRDGVEGAFNIGEIIRIQRKHDDYSISNKIFDFSSNTIKRLIQDGYNDAIDHIETRWGHKYLQEAMSSTLSTLRKRFSVNKIIHIFHSEFCCSWFSCYLWTT